jgi:Ca-activated chloride channel family protein
MEWQHPQWLYLILPLAVAWLVLSLDSRRRRRRAAEAFVAQAMWSRILPADSRGRFWAKLLLREIALVAGLAALAGPRFGTQYEDVIPRGSDLYVLIDVSRSMLAEDVPPSRLGRAKADVAALVNRLEGERVGLIAFAGQAVVKCPLTVDYDAFRRSLDELDPGSAPRGGTAIGDAIRKALEVFQAKSDRDQAILLITDGDDQQSYPLEAAAVAAERHVTIFTVGLGDADHGARIPGGAQAKSYLEYQGHQVWSKLDGSLLKEIALKTSGVYVPVGTRAYDLGELYAKYLQGRRGGEERTTKRIRRSDQFQIFLALALLALVADSFTRSYSSAVRSFEPVTEPGAAPRSERAGAARRRAAVPVSTALVLVALLAAGSRADNPADAVREGLSWYGKGDFDKARDRFATAREQFDTADAAKAAVAAFDQACAAHRKGDVAQAREWYLKAGLAHDKRLAASAHFNLGTLAAEEARRLAGEHPETVAVDKRQEVLDQLTAAVASFRHCLELQPDNTPARRDIELVRQWIKYYSDQWLAHDREKRRQETNLVAFLEYLIETQRALREAVKALPATAPADAFAEPKRLQDELHDEIAPLQEKITTELTPPPGGPGQAPPGQPPPGGQAPTAKPSELEQGIKLLRDWAGAAGDKMSSASGHLDGRQAGPAAADQQAAIDELEKIWDAVVPFQALLGRDLADQTKIAGSLAPPPAPAPAAKPGSDGSVPEKGPHRDDSKPAVKAPSAGAGPAALGSEKENLAPLSEIQQPTGRRTQLLKLKAEAELARLDKSPPPDAGQKAHDAPTGKNEPADGAAAKTKPVDPQQIKAGYQKAIELAPRAVEQMDLAVKSLKRNDAQAAYAPAEEARKVLEEIQKAQPKQDQQDQKKPEEDKKDKDKPKQEQKDQQKNDPRKDDAQKKDQRKKDQEDQKKKDQDEQRKKDQDEQRKKDQGDQKKKEESTSSDQKKQEEKQPELSRDQIESALRKVRERQQEKRERDRRMKARVFGGVPVEKDW